MPSCCPCEATAVETGPKRTADWRRVAFAGLIAAQSMTFSLAVNLSPPQGGIRTALHAVLAASAIAVFLLVGGPMLRAAIAAARQRRLVFDQLFLAGIVGAFAASLESTLTGSGPIYYEVVAVMLAIHTFGRILGERRRAAALDAARTLGDEFELCERVSADGRLERIPAGDIEPGDLVLVTPGSGIPVDGVIVEGIALVDEAAFTGEPRPVVRRPGDQALAGSRALDAPLRVRATVGGKSRQLDGIVARVIASQAQGSHLEREADRLVAWFLPTVFAIAALTFGIWTAHSGWTTGLFNALAVILVACPCSMGLAVPIGIWSAMADLASRGLVATDSDLVERLATVEAVIFDKTGTLSGDQLELVDFAVASGVDRTELLAAVATIEAASPHPVARAFRALAIPAIAQDIRVLPGVGIAGRVDGAEIKIGNASLLDAPCALASLLRGADAATHTLYILREDRPAGVALLRERLRAPARQVIADLEAAGISCTILTGDRPEAAAAHGLPNVHGGLSPVEKATHVHQIKARALFVGDGINDTPAMAEAHASLCLASGSEIARKVALGEVRDLRAIPYALARCRGAVRAIRQNLLFAAAYNFVGIGLAASGILHPVAAALLMLASSFTVTWRALRKPPTGLRRPLPPKTPDSTCCTISGTLPHPV